MTKIPCYLKCLAFDKWNANCVCNILLSVYLILHPLFFPTITPEKFRLMNKIDAPISHPAAGLIV